MMKTVYILWLITTSQAGWLSQITLIHKDFEVYESAKACLDHLHKTKEKIYTQHKYELIELEGEERTIKNN